MRSRKRNPANRMTAGPHDPDERGYAGAQEPIAFERLLAPIVATASEALQRRAPAMPAERLSGAARGALARELLSQLATASAPLLYGEFERYRAARTPAGRELSPTRAFDEFARDSRAGGLDRLRLEYPAWARLMATLVDRWSDASAELIERLNADWRALEAGFGDGRGALGEVIEVEPGLSDRHNGGRTVHGILFSSGARVVYKPRDLGPEAAVYGLLSWLGRRGGEVDLRAPGMLLRSGYGWMERIAPAECADDREARAFYRRAGGLLAVLYLLGATDCHAGNLIAAGPHPVLVDLETVTQPDLDPEEESVLLLTGLLPLWKPGLDGILYDVGALTGTVGLERTLSIWRFCAINTDEMQMAVEYRSEPSTESRLLLDGQLLQAGRYADDVVSGFSSAYRAILLERERLAAPAGPLAAFRRLHVRYLVRPTLSYAACIYRSVAPELLRSVGGRKAELERMLADGSARMPSSDADAAPAVRRAETEALLDLDVPYFTVRADSKGLETNSGRVAGALFARTGFRVLQRRLARMSEERLEAAVGVIRAALGVASLRQLLQDS